MLSQITKTSLAIIASGLIVLVCFCSKQSTKPIEDTTPPVAIALSPAKNSSGVAIGTQIFITFSEAVRADTLEKHLQLLPNLGRNDSVVYDAQSFKLALIPGKPLSYQINYY
jgi:hypothetical protein